MKITNTRKWQKQERLERLSLTALLIVAISYNLVVAAVLLLMP